VWRKRKKPERQPHPDPATELKLQRVISLMRMRASCEAQVAEYQRAIASTHDREDEALENGALSPAYDRYIPANQMNAILKASEQRRRSAEEGIREQRALITSLDGKITEVITQEGLTEYDLAYLDIAGYRHG
jgi:hypothetical protein